MKDCSARLAAQVRAARVAGERLAIRGNGSKHWLPPAPHSQLLDVSEHRGIVSYDPTELVVTVRAGTPLAELQETLAQSGQMLAAEVVDVGGNSTVGGAVALGWSGSRSAFAGSLRDFVLGCRIINGEGELLSFGGQVMKNVAGYDVSRLLVGSGGRFAVILEVSLKVLPLPEAQRSLALDFDALPEAVTYCNALTSRALPVSAAVWDGGRLRLRLSGAAASVDAVAAQCGGEEFDGSYWQMLRTLQRNFFGTWPGLRRVYRDRRDAPLALSGESLVDWNGALVWYRGPESDQQLLAQAAAARVETPGREPAPDGPLATINARLRQAFDPGGVFG